MTLTQILDTVQFVVDGAGERRAIQMDITMWQELLKLLEDLEDAEELRQLKDSEEEIIPWEQAKIEMRAAGIDV